MYKNIVSKNPKFDLNKHPTDFPSNDEVNKDSSFDDTALRLECFGHVTQQVTKSAPKDGCGLVLGLGPASRMNERDLVLKLGLSHCSTDHVVDEGARSVISSGGYMPSLILAPRISVPLQKLRISEPESSAGSDFWTDAALDDQIRGKKAQGSEVRCSHPTGCKKEARGKSGLCVNHVGGKRFVVEGCARSVEGQDGDRWCCFRGCIKEAQGSSMFCKVHGGGRKGAGGSTLLCKAHRGGKRCLYDGGGLCPKSVNDGTDICVAQDGGNSRVVTGWKDKSCSVVQDADEKTKGSLGITPQLFHRLVSGHGPVSPDNHSLSGTSSVSNSTNWLGNPAKRRQMIPPQVLVPSSMKSSFLPLTRQSSLGTDSGQKTLELAAPKNRVHSGSSLSTGDCNLKETV